MEKFAGEKMLNEILAKDPDSLVEDERAVLRARISYLSKEQIEKFGVGKAPKAVKNSKK